MPANDWSAKLWWSVPAAMVLLLMVLAMVLGEEPVPRDKGTSYDASPQGFRAAYLLLDRLGYPVARSKRLTGVAARLVLYPRKTLEDAHRLEAWITGGGVLVLADDSPAFAHNLGLEIKVRRLPENPGEEPATGGGVEHLAGGSTVVEGPAGSGRVWATAGDKPAVTVYPRGRGEIWLLNRPELFENRLMREADNAAFLCRLAEAVLEGRSGKLGFDEYFHGQHERPGVTELLFQPPTLWVTLEGLLLVGVLLWHYAPRFGALRPAAAPTRRSKEEFLDALAGLLERKGDYAGALRSARADLVQEICRELSLPPQTPVEEVAREAARRRVLAVEPLLRVLAGQDVPARPGSAVFVKALNDLETTRQEFFHGRHPR